MAEEQQSGKSGGFVSTVAKRALAPLVATAATAVTAYLMRKAAELWEEKLAPKIEEKGGGRAVAQETLETAADKVGGPASEKITTLAEKVGGEGGEQESPAPARSSSSSDAGREQERRRREKRRQERRRAIERTGSS